MSAGHLGVEKTLRRLQNEAYWVYMRNDVRKYCYECIRCQQVKPSAPTRAPLTNMPIGKPWQMVAVDVLEVPMSPNGNHYLLVIQDYFTKWAEAIPMPDQKAPRITDEVVKLFSRMGVPEVLHSDQGRNFESALLRQTLEAFGISKSRTTAYHPQGDGMVERLNRSILQMLRTYVETKDEWERHLPMVLYAYRTAVHASTGFSPFQLMYGRAPQFTGFSEPNAFDPTSYQAYLQAKLAEIRDFVETNLVEAAQRQKAQFDKHSKERSFGVGDPVWVSIPTAGKLDPRWEGNWTIKAIKSPSTFEISNANKCKVVHINRLRHRTEVSSQNGSNEAHGNSWTPAQIDHHIIVDDAPRYPVRTRRQPNWLGISSLRASFNWRGRM